METTQEKEMERFAVWYNHDGVKRAADVHRVELENQVYYKCRLFNGTEVEIERSAGEQERPSWKLLSGPITPLSIKLGNAIDERRE